MNSRPRFLGAVFVGALSIHLALAACSNGQRTTGTERDARADTLPVTATIDVAVEPCNKHFSYRPLGGSLERTIYYAEHAYVGATEDNLLAKLRTSVIEPIAGDHAARSVPGYPAIRHLVGDIQVKDGSAVVFCVDAETGSDVDSADGYQARFIYHE